VENSLKNCEKPLDQDVVLTQYLALYKKLKQGDKTNFATLLL